MGRNLFATEQQAQPTAPQGQPAPQKKGRNLFAGSGSASEFDQRTSGMSHEQIVDEYRKAPINSPYYNYLVKKIEAPKQGETQEQADLRSGGQKPAGAPSQGLSWFGGFAADRSYGWADELGAGVAALGGEDYNQALDKQRKFRDALAEENPGSYLGGQLTGQGVEIAATLGASAPLTWGGRLATNVGLGLGQGALNGLGQGDTMDERLSEAAWQGGIGAGVGVGLGAAEGLYKGGKYLVNQGVKNVQKVTNPAVAAEKDLIERMVKDRRAQMKLEERAAARGKPAPQRRFLTGQDALDAELAGQRTMVSDLGGDVTRSRLRAAGNVSPEAMNEMRGAANMRQVDQGQRVTENVSDAFGDLNPKTVKDELLERARTENDAAYGAAEQHPNASHLWNPVLQRALSTSWGKRALQNAIKKSRDKALRNGDEVIEPIFEEDANGLMQWTGRFRRPTGEVVDDIQGLGLGLRFWDSIKRSMGDDVTELLRAGRKDEAADIISIKNEMVGNIDDAIPEYKNARSGAADFFGMEDAHEAGAAYFKNMDAFNVAEARAALEKMKPAERELFARGYAAELVTRISKMGEAEDVNKLFKSPQARMKMRDALGDQVANQLEAFTHREMVQRLLGQHLGNQSPTAANQYAMEGLKAGASAGTGWYMTGDWKGALAGLAARGGYRYAQRAVFDRYARQLAELATSEDPDTIARILTKVSKDSGYMDFARAVSNGLSSGSQAAGRIEPRMPFADGGLVEDDRIPFANAGLVKSLAEYTLEKIAKKGGADVRELGHSFFNTKEVDKRDLIDNWNYKAFDAPAVIPHKPFDVNSMKAGDIIIPFYGDKAPTGRIVTEINGVPLVGGGGTLHGGPRYMQGSSQAVDNEVWRSHEDVIDGLDRKVVSALSAAAEKGVKDPSIFGFYVNMGNRSGDFAHNADLLARMAPNAGIPQKTVEAFDKKMRDVYPDFPGLMNTRDLLPYINHSGDGAGQIRKTMMKIADNGWMIDNGMPSPGAIRFAATEPELAALPDYEATGWTIGKRAPGVAAGNGAIHHPFYSTGYRGEYVGGLKPGLNHEKLFRDGANMADERRGQTGKKYQPQAFYKQNSARNDGYQIVDDDIMRLIEEMSR